jgi:hypothetical protein
MSKLADFVVAAGVAQRKAFAPRLDQSLVGLLGDREEAVTNGWKSQSQQASPDAKGSPQTARPRSGEIRGP